MRKADIVFAVTEADAAHFREIGCRRVLLMPSSHQDDEVVSKPSCLPQETGIELPPFALYHADLSVPENVKAVDFLAKNIFGQTDCRFVVAGRNPSKAMADNLSRFPNVELVPNPDNSRMHGLISDAQVQIMVTNLPVGLKLKLLNSLYAGRHCLVNSAMVAGTRLGDVCTVADTPQDFLSALNRLMHTPFTEKDIAERRRLLGDLYSNQANAQILINCL